MTAALVCYARMRRGGFRMFPLQANKTSKYLAIYGSAFVASWFGNAWTMNAIGDRNQYKYLRLNSSAILRGEKPMEGAHKSPKPEEGK